MLTCKFGNWWETNPQRGRANNSAVLLRNMIDKACNEKSMQELKSEENTIRFLSFIKFLLKHEIQGLENEGEDF